MKTIAAACGCSKNAARAATDELVRRGELPRPFKKLRRRAGVRQFHKGSDRAEFKQDKELPSKAGGSAVRTFSGDMA